MVLTTKENTYLTNRLRELFELGGSVSDANVLMSTKGSITRALLELGIAFTRLGKAITNIFK